MQKRYYSKKAIHALLLALFIAAGGAEAATEDEALYYATEPAVNPAADFEVRLSSGHDYSNPYLSIYPISGGIMWLASPYLSFGFEVSKFYSTQRQSVAALENALGDFGFQVVPAAPDWSAAAVARITPLSGLVNFFGRRVVPASISLIVKGGTVKHTLYPPGPFFGTGLEVFMGMGRQWGVILALNWEVERPENREWVSRAGFRIGPSVRF